MSQTVMSVKVDADIKKKADVLFKKLGMNTNTAINVFLRQAIRNQEIPFPISATSEKIEYEAEEAECDEGEGFWDPRNQAYLKEQVRLYNEGKLKFTAHELIEV